MANSMTDQYLANNQHYASGEAMHRPSYPGKQPIKPAKRAAVVACMDARLDVEDLLGLQTGDAHVIRNAGGVVTDDAIRSLVISHHLLDTKEIILIHHTRCGMLVTARDIVMRLPDADEARIRRELSGNLCRCTGYVGIVRAIQRVLDARRA